MTVHSSVDLGRAIRGGVPVALELAFLFCAGGSAATVGWALLDPLGPGDSTPVHGGNSASAAVAHLAADPFARQGSRAQLASYGSAEGYALHATRVSSAGGSAILTAPGLPQMSYGIGSSVGLDARLVHVASDHVELERAGQRIRVSFPQSTATSLLAAAGQPPVTGSQVTGSQAFGGQAFGGQTYGAPAGSSGVQGTGTQGTGVQGAVAPPTEEVAAALGFSTIQRSNGRLGLTVSAGSQGGIAAAAGLQPGDVVLALNGREITPEGLAARQGELLSGGPIDIQFERNGQVLTTRLGRL